MVEVKLPSGATLRITSAPFIDSKNLYQAILEEMKQIEFKSSSDVSKVIKDIIAIGFSSKKIEAALEVCFKRCLYNSGTGDFKIDGQTFESERARGDYITVCIEVAKANILPFMKSLYAEFQQYMSILPSVQA